MSAQLSSAFFTVSALQRIKCLNGRLCCLLCTRRIGARDQSAISNMERIPNSRRPDVYFTRGVSLANVKKLESKYKHLAPCFSAVSSTSGSFQVLIVSMSFITSSPSEVKPVIVLPLMMDLPVDASITPP